MRDLTMGDTRVPVLGLGTWLLNGHECRRAVAQAIAMGYRHIDTAQSYGNEAAVGAGIADSGVYREDLFVVTKVADENRAPERIRSAVQASLEALQIPTLSLLLLHRPGEPTATRQALLAMHELVAEGLVQHVGVSNFSVDQVRAAQETGPILTNQITHNVYEQRPLRTNRMRDLGLLVTAHSPLAHGGVLDDPVLTEIGARYDKSPAQIALRWLLDQPRTVAIPKASQTRHLSRNMRIFDFTLDEEDRRRIALLDRERKDTRTIGPLAADMTPPGETRSSPPFASTQSDL